MSKSESTPARAPRSSDVAAQVKGDHLIISIALIPQAERRVSEKGNTTIAYCDWIEVSGIKLKITALEPQAVAAAAAAEPADLAKLLAGLDGAQLAAILASVAKGKGQNGKAHPKA